MRSALTMEYRRIFLFYASARAFRLHELHYLTAMVVDTSGGGPAVGPSGQTYRNAAHLVKMIGVLTLRVSYHSKISPILRWSRQPRSKNQRSPLDVKAPAHSGD